MAAFRARPGRRPSSRPATRPDLLRLWREGPGAPWRASLEVPSGEATFRFGIVGALFAFLRDQLAAHPDRTRTRPAPPGGAASPGSP